MRLARLALLLVSCSRSEPGVPAPPALRPIAQVPEATLVAGSRQIALVTGLASEVDARWYATTPAGLDERRELAAPLAKLRRELGDERQIFLGAQPIVAGGEEHHERIVRLPSGTDVPLAGHVVRIATTRAGHELWQYEDRLRDRLAVDGVTPVPDHALAGPAVTTMSPVGTKKCAAPQIADLATADDAGDAGDAIVALLVECNPDAPVRLATYRWPGPTVRVVALASPNQLGFTPARLAGTALVGAANGSLVIARAGAPPHGYFASARVSVVVAAARADDGAVWTLAIAGDHPQVARDGVPVAIADPAGQPLVPSALAYDEHHGVVVLAGAWLLGQR